MPELKNEVNNIVDDILSGYKTQLKNVIADHDKMLEKSRLDMIKLVEQSNKELIDLTEKLDKNARDAEDVIEEEKSKPIEPVPETAWVDGHLVLNPQAVDTLNNMFSMLKEILPEIAEIVKR